MERAEDGEAADFSKHARRLDPGRERRGVIGGSPGLQACRRLDAVVALVRVVCALMVMIMSVLFVPVSRAAALVLAAGALAYSLHSCVGAASRPVAGRAAARAARRSVALDAILAAATYVLFLPDPHALPVAFVPLLIFELTARYGKKGLLAAGLTAALALSGRIYFQLRVIDGGAVRAPVLILWLAVCALVAAFALEISAREHQYLAAVGDRGRIAESFRATVEQVLARSGVRPDSATISEAVQELARICGDEPPGQWRTTRLAELITTARDDLGLTRREQEIASMLAAGRSCAHMAAELLVSQSTVRNHIHRIKTKLGLHSREELIALLRGSAPAPGGRPAAAGPGNGTRRPEFRAPPAPDTRPVGPRDRLAR